jgi:peptidoglycan/LPS O-acetylase OafA/YrhL
MVIRTSKADHRRKLTRNGSIVRELLIIVPAVIGLFVLAFFFALSEGHEALIKWGGLVAYTAAIFGIFIKHSRRYLRRQRFWLLTILLLAAHLAAFAIILTHVETWRLTWFVVMVLELPVLVFLRNRLSDPSVDGKA